MVQQSSSKVSEVPCSSLSEDSHDRHQFVRLGRSSEQPITAEDVVIVSISYSHKHEAWLPIDCWVNLLDGRLIQIQSDNDKTEVYIIYQSGTRSLSVLKPGSCTWQNCMFQPFQLCTF